MTCLKICYAATAAWQPAVGDTLGATVGNSHCCLRGKVIALSAPHMPCPGQPSGCTCQVWECKGVGSLVCRHQLCMLKAQQTVHRCPLTSKALNCQYVLKVGAAVLRLLAHGS